MKVYAELAVSKQIAAGLNRNPAHVQECIQQAEIELNMVAMERKCVIAERPKLVQISDSALVPDMIVLKFEAETRSL
jgi:hypothetical protein